jgi:hypothetical protein
MKKTILFLVMAVALTTQTLFAQVPSYVPTSGLVGYWPFNGNANNISGSNNNGTVNGAALIADRFGNINSAYSFNGISDYIRVVNSPSLNNSSFTLSGWFNTNNLPLNPGEDAKGIVGKWWQTPSVCESNYNSFLTVLTKPIGQNNSYLGGATDLYAGDVFYSNTSVNTNNWYHFIFIHDEMIGGKLYINGVLTNSNLLDGSVCNSTNDLIIGADILSGSVYRFFNGKIDDIGIWNRALTQEEITNLYNANQCITNITVTDTLVINVGQLSFNDPVTWANNITISPNPASSQININFNNITNLNGGTLKIINSLGQQVATTPITTSGTNSTMQLATWGGTGMYFVQIINPQGQIVDIKKIILQ